MNKKVLVVAAHPDDEILGCGGTILKHISNGDDVRIIIMAEGLTSRNDMRDIEKYQHELNVLYKNTCQVAAFMGAKKVKQCNFPDNRMDSIALLDVIKPIEEYMGNFQPDTVYTHHAGDVNIDHMITHNAVITACRPLPGQSVHTLLFFETLSSTEWQMQTSDKVFLPNWYVDISNFFEKKIKALRFYESEMREYPHPRSYKGVEILAKSRGLIIGTEFAEAFSIGRIIR
ncbi:N-acetylglucosaminyl deacetylase, LmbE family [Propionispira arboris]|uniref:N-acetylglucosaminyl deacetylase, LmbE family n=1 Tax=Propionispira arboris TaxID=84035 RepID=A0A1H7CDZ9_9FIRM|nr:PIG-L family deacetylase [Propionispira arboris]SEJ87929.1 N-acetylglucosaminyl deacetylase, LmbE family [Propionispira arboris]